VPTLASCKNKDISVHCNDRISHYLVINNTFLLPPPGVWFTLSNDPHLDCARSGKCSTWLSIYTCQHTYCNIV